MGSKQRLELGADSSMEQKTWQVYSFGKRNVFRLHLNESREGFCQLNVTLFCDTCILVTAHVFLMYSLCRTYKVFNVLDVKVHQIQFLF